jgi:hypothetical protein
MDIIDDPLISSTDARRLLGGITPTTLWRWERDGIIAPAVRIRNRKYFRRSAVVALATIGAPGNGELLSGKRAPTEEPKDGISK